MMNVSSVQHTSVRDEALALLSRLGVPESAFAHEGLPASSAITGEAIAHVRITSPGEATAAIGQAVQAFTVWRTMAIRASRRRPLAPALLPHHCDRALGSPRA
jgi:aldehyde dehydrogenase (NAD+)